MERLAVVGTGLIGASIGLAAARAGRRVAGWDPDPEALAAAVARGAVSEPAAELAGAVAGSELVVVAAPIIFRTVREADPTLPKVLSVNLEGQHSTLLAATIMSNLLKIFGRVQLVCAGVLLPVIIAQWFLMMRINLVAPVIRSLAYVGATVFLIYNIWVVAPRAHKYRQEYIDHADEPDLANPALDQFDRYHHENEMLLMILTALVLLMILFSGDIHPPITNFTFGG